MLALPCEVGAYNGYIVRFTGTNGFKLAWIVGEDGGMRCRCHLWREATGQWTKTRKLIRFADLSPITAEEKVARGAMINRAMEATGRRSRVWT